MTLRKSPRHRMAKPAWTFVIGTVFAFFAVGLEELLNYSHEHPSPAREFFFSFAFLVVLLSFLLLSALCIIWFFGLKRTLSHNVAEHSYPLPEAASPEEPRYHELHMHDQADAVCCFICLRHRPSDPALQELALHVLGAACAGAKDHLCKSVDHSLSCADQLRRHFSPQCRIDPHGVLLVWALPAAQGDGAEGTLKTLFSVGILDFIGYLESEFKNRIAAQEGPLHLVRIAIGVSCGPVRVSSIAGDRNSVFLGGAVDDCRAMASSDVAMVTVNFQFASLALMERFCFREGRFELWKTASAGDKITIWTTAKELRRRCEKKGVSDNVIRALEWINRSYCEIDSTQPVEPVMLSACDAWFIFKLRWEWEARFARNFARSVCERRKSMGEHLKRLQDVINRMKVRLDQGGRVLDEEFKSCGRAFHEEIASATDERGPRLSGLFYERTGPVYRCAVHDSEDSTASSPSEVVREHNAIFQRLCQCDEAGAGNLITNHLSSHYQRALDALLQGVFDVAAAGGMDI